MFEWHFFGQNMKKRLVRALLGAAATAILFFLWEWILQDAFHTQAITVLIGGCMSVFYLLGGIGTAIWGTGFFALIVAVRLLPSPWNIVGILAIILAIPIRNQINKRRLKQDLLQNNPDMTEAQAAEIIATAGSVYSGSYDDIRREADAVMDTGFLLIETATLRHHKQYLLSPDTNGLTLYGFDRQERMQALIQGDPPAEPAPGDIRFGIDGINGITLLLKKRMGIEKLHIIVNAKEKTGTYLVTGSASAKQVEEFIATHCGIPVNNLVQTDREPLVQMPNIVESIRRSDSETVARLRSSRWLNRWITALSAISLSFLLFGVKYPILHILMLLCPVVVTVFYILRQEDVRFDGSRQGKPSVFLSYFCNPVFTAMFAWVIILDMMKLTCLSRHPFTWLFGILGAAAFLFCTLRFLRECKGKIGIKIGMIVMAVGFGGQITAVLLLFLHQA